MSFNGGMDDTQNWPFSVRYTASPYRKSSIPPGTGNGGVENSNNISSIHGGGGDPSLNPHFNARYSNNANSPVHATTNQSGATQRLVPSCAAINNPSLAGLVSGPHGVIGQQYNPMLLRSDFNIRPNIDNEYLQQQQQQQYHNDEQHHHAMQGNVYYNSQKQYFVPDHHHYGLPLPTTASNPPLPSPNPNSHFFHKQRNHFSSNFPVVNENIPHNFSIHGVLDEGYIEDLKQTNIGGIQQNLGIQQNRGMTTAANNNEFGVSGESDGAVIVENLDDNKQLEYDPYSYVYDSKNPPPESRSLFHPSNGAVVSKSVSGPFNGFGGGCSGDKSFSRSASGSSENEYEEIHDVARYMNQGPMNGPCHFKSFSSTDDILAEVVQVQQRHDRVLDQLNLEVENLLIRSTTEIEERSQNYENDITKLADTNMKTLGGKFQYNTGLRSTLSHNHTQSHCYCSNPGGLDQKITKSHLQTGDLNITFSHSHPMLKPLKGGSVSNNCARCCSDQFNGSLTLPHCCSTNTPNENEHLMLTNLCRSNNIRSGSGTLDNCKGENNSKSDGNGCGSIMSSPGKNPTTANSSNKMLSMSRKKKLDRSLTADTNFTKGGGIPASKSLSSFNTSRKDLKTRYQRSYSLIPHWKIRDHLMRLPFLNKQDKNKKVEIPSEYADLKRTCVRSSTLDSGTKLLGPPQQPQTTSSSSSVLLHHHHLQHQHHPTNQLLRCDFPVKQQPVVGGPQLGSGQCMDENKSVPFAVHAAATTATSTATAAVTTTKLRSSSMDELRTTGTEEHWYSADSDTEPDSLITALAVPSEISGDLVITPTINTNTTSSSSVSPNKLENRLSSNTKIVDDDIDINFASHNNNSAASVPVHHNINNSLPTDNLPTIDIRNGIHDVPKAPKFRRGSGLKEKWRDSWSHSKTISKNGMDDDNRLTRWFSLRKNHVNINEDGGHNRHSTLPQLSEEDLKRISFIEDEEGYWPRRQVQPPSLPTPPPDLTPGQVTRRHIVAAIVHSENNYVAALQRLVNEYKKPLECSHPAILSHSKISTIFHRVPEILQCHSLFRIALAECVRRWDADEKIGDVFVASFSKSLVLDVYSEFINNFGQAMETAKIEARRKSAFADFLKVKQMTAHDRLSLFGLMVKPVQRFPQFILLLQDLLKHTPKEHHDRMSLQLALTQLESLAAMLNERKRESEQYQAFRETIKSISGGKFVLLRSVMDDPNRILLRQDVVTQLDFDGNGGSVTKSKCRKLLLLNDMLICVGLSPQGGSNNDHGGKGGDSLSNGSNGGGREGGSHNNKSEKSVFKWSFPVKDIEVEDISISPTMSRFVQNGAGGNVSKNSNAKGIEEGNFASVSLLEEMQSLMYDYEVLSRVLTLVSSLKSSYEGLTESSVKELMMEIQLQIRCRDEQISYFDSSCLTLLLGSATSNNREKVMFQMQSPAVRNEWVEELRLSQLALDSNNSPAWDIPHESPYPLHKLPLFVRALPLSKSPHMTTVKCGCFFTHTFVSPTGRSKILDYLWVSSTDGISSHVTAFKSQQNTLKEVSSFDLVEEKINAFLFVLGRVWVATDSRKVMIYDPAHPEGGSYMHCLLSDSVLQLTLFENIIYAGLADGNLAVFMQIKEPKTLKPDLVIKIGCEKVTSVFGSREHIYVSCGNSVVTIDAKTHIIERNVSLTHHQGPISHMTCSGVGLWITTHESETVCLYHLETLQHLQDVSVAPSVFRTVRDSFRRQKGCHVTCLTAHKGWLWIGTNLGVVLTIPLPRLEGVPIISTGKANVSYHGFCGPVTFLMPLTKQSTPSLSAATIARNNNNSSKNDFHNISTPQIQNSSSTTTPSISESFSQENENAKISSSVSRNPKLSGSSRSLELPVHPEEEDERDVAQNSTCVSNDNVSITTSAITTTCSTPATSTAPTTPLMNHISDTSSGSNINVKLGDGCSSENSCLINKTLVVLRKKNSRDNMVSMRNCKTLPRGGTIPSRFSIDSDVYGLYGNLINVRGLEDEGRFVDPLYDALRRSDPELVNLDVKINTLDRRTKMRMSRPRSLDLSNWSVDSKISASSDESVGGGLGSRNSQVGVEALMMMDGESTTTTTTINGTHQQQPSGGNTTTATSTIHNEHNPSIPQVAQTQDINYNTNKNIHSTPTSTNTNKASKTISRQQHYKKKEPQDRTVVVVVGGRGYVNMKTTTPLHQDYFSNNNSEYDGKLSTYLNVWQMKT